MGIWSILLLKSDLKWCTYLSRSLFQYLKYFPHTDEEGGGNESELVRKFEAGELKYLGSEIERNKDGTMRYEELCRGSRRQVRIEIWHNCMTATLTWIAKQVRSG